MLKKLFYSSIKILLLVYIFICVLMYVYQDKLLYHPTPYIQTNYQQLILHRTDANVYTYIIHPKEKDAIIYFGGNGESMAVTASHLDKEFTNFACYLMDYRGYGKSTGNATQNKLFADALALYDKIHTKHKHIYLIGRSLGSGIATYLASKRDIKKLILITPYDSIESVAKNRFVFLPVSFLLKDRYHSTKFVPDINASTLILMAQKDKVIPNKHTYKLIDVFKSHHKPINVITIQNRGHNSISYDKSYYISIKKFLKE